MKKNLIKTCLLLGGFCLGSLLAYSQKIQSVTLDLTNKGIAIQPTMWGIFFEDINFGADGGLYGEMVKNRSFQFNQSLMGWKEIRDGQTISDFAKPINSYFLDRDEPMALVEDQSNTDPNNPKYLRLTLNAAPKTYALYNEGFRGMGIFQDSTYDFSIRMRNPGSLPFKFVAQLIRPDGSVIAQQDLEASVSDQWSLVSAKLRASDSCSHAGLRLWIEGKGTLDINRISLFPDATWKNRPGGLRRDLVQRLYDLKPGFLRFPGGCIVEGRELASRYQWKNTVGSLESRRTLINRWNQEVASRQTPDYFQSFGLGFYEYFLLCEDLGAAPLPIINCGMACEFNSAEVASLQDLDSYVQDALDLIEFANGDITTKWGRLRSEMGHPIPFGLTMIGIGNEQWGPQYIERYKLFEKAIHAKYPTIKLVSSMGALPDGKVFDQMATYFKQTRPDFQDEHYYKSPEWFQNNAKRYDDYSRKGPRVFVGEYAAQSVGMANTQNRNTWLCALSEASYMTGLERNADIVNMASYAPLLSNREAWQWTPDLIWFDNMRTVPSISYYVQKLFSINKGSIEYPAFDEKGASLTGQDSLYLCCAKDEKTDELILKVVNTSSQSIIRNLNLKGKLQFASQGTITVLASKNLDCENTFDSPDKVIPYTKDIRIAHRKSFSLTFRPYSLNIIRVKLYR